MIFSEFLRVFLIPVLVASSTLACPAILITARQSWYLAAYSSAILAPSLEPTKMKFVKICETIISLENRLPLQGSL
jgi:hypothetical protein